MTIFIWSLLIGLIFEIFNFIGGGDLDDGGEHAIDISLFARFLIGFGASGIILCTWQETIGEQLTYFIAGVMGCALTFFLRKFIRFISKAGNPSLDTMSFEGLEGIVITPVGEKKPGEISVMGGNKKYFLKAYSADGGCFTVGEKIRIVVSDGSCVKINRENGDV